MTDQNPYQAPDANLTEGRRSSEVELEVTGIKSLPAMQGWQWIKDAFAYFMMNPLVWILIILVWFGINFIGQLIPIIGPLATSLIYAVFVAGMLHGCVSLDRGEGLEVGHLFAGFKENTGPLIGLGAMYFAVIIVFALIVGVLIAMMLGGADIVNNPESLALEMLASPGLLIVVLLALGIMIPIAMVFWFAPALIALGGEGVIDSMKLSLQGCLKNIFPFLIYGIAMTILAIIASIPFFLGWLVLLPVGMATFYTAYCTIYTDRN